MYTYKDGTTVIDCKTILEQIKMFKVNKSVQFNEFQTAIINNEMIRIIYMPNYIEVKIFTTTCSLSFDLKDFNKCLNNENT